MDFAVRPEAESDIEQVSEILRSSFPTDAESRLVDALRDNGKAIVSLVAINGRDVLGHILFSPVSTTPLSEAKGIGLAPVAVKPEFQSKGIGSQLCREGLRRGKELGYDYVVVLGSPEYYSRFGFVRASDFDLQNEYGVDDEFMVQYFTENRVRGLVRYAVEFFVFSV